MVGLWIFLAILVMLGGVIGFFAHWEDGIGKSILHGFIGMVIMASLMSMVYFGAKYEAEKDEKLYNNGICSECGGEYHLVGASNSRGNKHYVYECSECLCTVELNSRMK